MAYQIAFDLEESATQDFLLKVIKDLPATKKLDANEMETDDTPSGSNDERFEKIKTILSGVESIKLYLEFLYRKNHTDLLILKNTKVGVFNSPGKRKILTRCINFICLALASLCFPLIRSTERLGVAKFSIPLGCHLC